MASRGACRVRRRVEIGTHTRRRLTSPSSPSKERPGSYIRPKVITPRLIALATSRRNAAGALARTPGPPAPSSGAGVGPGPVTTLLEGASLRKAMAEPGRETTNGAAARVTRPAAAPPGATIETTGVVGETARKGGVPAMVPPAAATPLIRDVTRKEVGTDRHPS